MFIFFINLHLFNFFLYYKKKIILGGKGGLIKQKKKNFTFGGTSQNNAVNDEINAPGKSEYEKKNIYELLHI